MNGQPNGYEDLIKGFVDNVRLLARYCKEWFIWRRGLQGEIWRNSVGRFSVADLGFGLWALSGFGTFMWYPRKSFKCRAFTLMIRFWFGMAYVLFTRSFEEEYEWLVWTWYLQVFRVEPSFYRGSIHSIWQRWFYANTFPSYMTVGWHFRGDQSALSVWC